MARDGNRRGETHINRHVFPQAPSPTMTSFRRSSAILEVFDVGFWRRGEDADAMGGRQCVEICGCKTRWGERQDAKRSRDGVGLMSERER